MEVTTARPVRPQLLTRLLVLVDLNRGLECQHSIPNRILKVE